MHMQSAQVNIRIACRLLNNLFSLRKVYSEFVFLFSRGSLCMSICVDVRIYPQGYSWCFISLSSEFINVFKFCHRFYIKHKDVVLKGILYLPVHLSNTGKYNPRRVAASLDSTKQFTAGNHIETRSLLC